MQIRLRACGVDVHTASTAMQALWIAMKEIPDVIITDYHMPEGSGQYLLGRLKGTPLLKDIPVIMLTGARIGNDRDFALERRFLGEYRAAAFLSKPVDLDVLLDALSEHIAIDPEVRQHGLEAAAALEHYQDRTEPSNSRSSCAANAGIHTQRACVYGYRRAPV